MAKHAVKHTAKNTAESAGGNGRGKWVLVAAAALLAAFFLLRPYLGGAGGAAGGNFSITAQPVAAMAEAKAAGRPVFLEFYASW